MLSLLLLHVRCGKISISGTAESGETLATQSPDRLPPPVLSVGTGPALRLVGCFYVPVAQQREQQPIEEASGRFKSAPEHQFAADPVGGASLTHGLIPTFGWRVREKGSFLPFLVEPPHAVGGHRIHKPVQAFPAGCASVLSQHGNVLSFYIPVAQVMERRSPKPQDAGLSPAGNAICVAYEEAAQTPTIPAAYVLDGAAPRPVSACPELNV